MSGLQFRKTALGRSLFLRELVSGLLTCFPDLRRMWTVAADPNLTSVGTSAGFVFFLTSVLEYNCFTMVC